MQVEQSPPALDYTLYEDFYHALLKMYVSLVGSPFVLERFCLRLFRQERFSSHFDLDILKEACDELQS